MMFQTHTQAKDSLKMQHRSTDFNIVEDGNFTCMASDFTQFVKFCCSKKENFQINCVLT